MKIMTIFGTRPEAIKLAPVIRELRHRRQEHNLQPLVCSTGQHRQMVDQVLELFRIRPDIDLDLMRPNQTPSQVAARILSEIEPVLLSERPDWVLVQGDTTTVMAASIAAHHAQIRIGHVEAGLRTGDFLNPFPEEMNRVVVGHICDLNFAPTARSRQNLLREGIADERICITGNPVIDALHWVSDLPFDLATLGISRTASKMILVTAHRRENHGKPLQNICMALRELAHTRHDIQIVFPVHLNPNVSDVVHKLLGDIPRVKLLPPLDYLALVHIMKSSHLILTDSGGIQEEAPGLGVPVLVLRETTERPEAVEAGVAKTIGTEQSAIVTEVNRLLNDSDAYANMATGCNPYGDGRAAKYIVDALLRE